MPLILVHAGDADTQGQEDQKFTVILKDDIFKEFKATLGFMNPRKTGDGDGEAE